jgi:hypothetical protein
MAKVKGDTSYVRIKHRMNDDEKRLFRLLFEYAMPELHVKNEHTISAKHLLELWAPEKPKELAALFLERAFWHLGVTLTYSCTANPQRPSWGGMALFNGRSIKPDGTFTYSYTPQFKKMMNLPIVSEQLEKEGLAVKMTEQPATHESTSHVSYMAF